ncbi:Spo0E family sporulation regulatory protein-aspartic acid phosphatase [Paenibacillus apiarius]|uniref:Spo0E family sporulation regulatory protein-aspartic acid phosphatase n=1 Tax=Paenibacillus apiarius TaxID=46240 RepID=UPI003B3B0F42
MGSVSTVISTLGELIQRYRNERSMTQTQLGDFSKISRGSISKIENGNMKRLNYKTIQPIIFVLQIPLHEVLDHFMLTDPRSETLFELLLDSIAYQDSSLTAKIASLFLTSRDEESGVLLKKLFHMTQQLSGTDELQLTLFNTVITYARIHGKQSYVAQGMLHKYLVQRNDFSKLEETYESGKFVLQYVEFLSSEERVTLYYKLGVHAYHLRRFNECIELLQKYLKEDNTDSSLKAYSTLAICSSYFHQKQYDLAEKYLKAFSLFNFPFVKENVDFMTAKLNERKGKIELAIEQLKQCLDSSTHKINIVNSLLTYYLSNNDLHAAYQLFQREQEFMEVDLSNPIIKNGNAHYYIKKGKYFNKIGKQNEAVDSFIKSVNMFEELSEADETLIRKIENTRLLMIKAVQEGKNFTDDDVVQLSQELDTYLVEIQKKGLIKRVMWTS